jgi:hypothetical protein
VDAPGLDRLQYPQSSIKHSGSTIRESLLMRNMEVEVMAYFTVIFSAMDRTGLFFNEDVISSRAHF